MSIQARVLPEQRYTRDRPCPICGRSGDMPSGRNLRCWGFLSIDGKFAFCTEVGGSQRNEATNSFMHRMRGTCSCGQIHGTGPLPTPTPLPHRAPAVEPLQPGMLHWMWQRYLALLPMRTEHQHYYAGRGTDDLLTAEACGYGSLPLGFAEGERVVSALVQEFGEDHVERMPGFWRGRNGRLQTHTASQRDDAAVIPCRNERGMIVSMVRQSTTGGTKYRNFQGSHELYTHYNGEAEPSGDLWITEGAHKAHVAAKVGRFRVLGLMGATLTDAALEALGEIKPNRIITALDMDRLTNPDIAHQQDVLLKKLREAGYTVAVATWDVSVAKGLDDLLMLHLAPELEADFASSASITPDGGLAWDGLLTEAQQNQAEEESKGINVPGRRKGWYQARNPELSPLSTHRGDNSGSRAGFTLFDRSEAVEREDMVNRLLEADPALEGRAGRLRRCMREGPRRCVRGGSEHGDYGWGRETCRDHWCPLCPTDTTNLLARTRIPEIEPGQRYRSLHLKLHLPEAKASQRGNQAAYAAEEWSQWVGRVGGRKAWKGRILHRAFAVKLCMKHVELTLPLLFVENTPSEVDELLADLQKRLVFGKVRVGGDVSFSREEGDLVAIQAMEDSSCCFLGMEDPQDTEAFASVFSALRRKKLYQPLGPLAEAMKVAREEKEKVTPPSCTVCGAKIVIILTDENGTYIPQPPTGRWAKGQRWRGGGEHGQSSHIR